MRYLFYQGSISPVGVRNTQTLIASAYSQGLKEITLCLSSDGGDVTSGVGLYNFLEMFPMEITTYAAGVCGSIAATIMMAGSRRIASRNSNFVLHASTYTSGPFQGQVSLHPATYQPFVEKLGWTLAEVNERFPSGEFFISSDDALKMNIVNEIKTLKLNPDDEILTILVP